MDKENIIKYGLVGAAIIAAGFVAMALIKGVVALAFVLVGAIVVVNAVPVFARWAAQMKIKGMQYTAMKNPIPELKLQRIKHVRRINKAIDAVTEFSGEKKTFKEKLEKFQQTNPDQVIRFAPIYEAMKKTYTHQIVGIRKARAALAEFDVEIEAAENIWEMTLAASKASKALKGFNQPDPMDEIMQKTAFGEVSSALNRVVAEMEVSLDLDYNKSDVVENLPSLELDTKINSSDFQVIKEEINVSTRR